MSERLTIQRWDFDDQCMKTFSYSPEKVKEFIAWMLNTSLWKEYPETLLVDKCMKLRKELLESLTPDVDVIAEKGLKRDEKGRLMKRAAVG